MKQNLLRKFWLRVCMLVAVILCGAGSAWGETFQKITSTSGLEYGARYLIVCESSNKALKEISTTSTKYGIASSVTISDGTITASSSDVMFLTLKGSSSSGWEFEIDAESSLGWKTGNSLISGGEGSDNYKWTISFSDENASIANKNDNNRKIVYNSSSPRFACYTTAQTAVQLYKEVISSAVSTTTTIDASGITNTDVYTSTAAGSLAASVKDASNNVINGATITWSGNNDAVATINASTGAVTLVAAGTVTFTASYVGVSGQYQASSDTYEMTVSDSTPFTGGTVTFIGGTDKGSSQNNNDGDQVTKQVVTISSTLAAFDNDEYRIYKNSETTFTVPEGYYITQIVFADTDKSGYACSNLNVKSGTAGTYNPETYTWTGNSRTAVFVAGAQARASQIVVSVASGTPKQNAEVTISATELEVNGEVATATVTTNGPTVTLTTSDATIASVSGTTVTAVGAGTATITATWDGNDTFNAGTTTFTVTVTDNTPVTSDWVLTNLADLTADDIFVIVGNNGSNYALANDKGASAAPTAVSVNVSGDYLTGTVADNIKWNVSGDATNGYTFYPDGSTTTWLYCTSSNNGVRVGTNSNKIFTIVDGYLMNSATSRYVGIYNSQDWRCYTSTTTNIGDQTFTFYKYVGAPAPSITASNVEIAYDATSGSIEYTIENSVTGGTLSATTEADWLTIGTSTATEVQFTTTNNASSIIRSATVTLTYTYGSATTTKTITVTQAGNPDAKGGANNPYNVAEALDVIASLADGGKTESEVYVSGIISNIDEVSVYNEAEGSVYGNATYFISDDGTATTQLEVFRGYYLENAKFTAADQIQAGDEVVICGQLQKYVKGETTTPEIAQGNYIVSLNRPIKVTVGSAGYTTYVTPAAVSFPVGVEAFIVTAINEGSMHMEEVTAVPANTPIVVKAAANTYELIEFAEEPNNVSGNLLLASDGTVQGGSTIYVLANKSKGVGFYPTATTITIPEGKAYLDTSATGNVKEFIAFDFGGTDAINSIDNGQLTVDSSVIYNVAGQRVGKMTKGIYVVNGKKVIVK